MLWLAVFSVVLAVVSAAGLAFDSRQLVGAPIWLKPFKFAVSSAIYGITLAWLLPKLGTTTRSHRWGNRLGILIATMLAAEDLIIVTQVIRGRASHFNLTTSLDAALWSSMGFMIVALWVGTAGVAILSWRVRVGDRSTTWALRLSLGIALVGMAIAFAMTGPTAEQLQGLQAGGAPTMIGAHSVGVADGGPGLPITGWSTVAGDLRVPHFVGLHAIQALLILAFVLARFAPRFQALKSESVRTRVVVIAAAAYFWVLAVLTWQALRGQSVVRPDALTVIVTGALTLATLIVGGIVLARARPTTAESVPAATVPQTESVRQS